MHRKAVPTENRLLLCLAKHGGSATLTQIRRGFYGRLTTAVLDQASQKLGDLVLFESARASGSKRPTTRLSLTLRGWAAVQSLQHGWQPRRLAVPVLKTWLKELQEERDPWACQFLKDAEDGQAWRNHEARRKEAERAAVAKRAKREKPEPKYPSAGRNRSEEDIEARAEWFREKTGKNPSYAADAEPDTENLNQPTYNPIPTPPTPHVPLTDREAFFASLRQQHKDVAETDTRRQSYMPKDCRPAPPADPAVEQEIARIKQKAVRLRMADAICDRGMRWDNRIISFAEWDQNVSD